MFARCAGPGRGGAIGTKANGHGSAACNRLETEQIDPTQCLQPVADDVLLPLGKDTFGRGRAPASHLTTSFAEQRLGFSAQCSAAPRANSRHPSGGPTTPCGLAQGPQLQRPIKFCLLTSEAI